MNKPMIVATLLVWPASALGQFFDDFDGPALLPHWNPVSPPSHWAYDFNGGMLNVTGLFYPSLPKIGSNNAYMIAFFPQLGQDFVARIRMGWDAGDGRGMALHVGNELTNLGVFGFTEQKPGDPVVFAQTLGAPGFFPAPPAGVHDFAMVGTAATVEFWLNGSLLTVLPRPSGGGPRGVLISFLSDFPNPSFAPLHIDRVEVVPAPAPIALIGAGLLAFGAPRRRQ